MAVVGEQAPVPVHPLPGARPNHLMRAPVTTMVPMTASTRTKIKGTPKIRCDRGRLDDDDDDDDDERVDSEPGFLLDRRLLLLLSGASAERLLPRRLWWRRTAKE